MFSISDINYLVKGGLDALLRRELGQIEYFQASVDTSSTESRQALSGRTLHFGGGFVIGYRGETLHINVRFKPLAPTESIPKMTLPMGDPDIYKDDPDDEAMRVIIDKRIKDWLGDGIIAFLTQTREDG